MRRFIMNLLPQLKDIYSPGETNSRGRLISLISSLVTSFYNVFITGIFYTGFLSMYGISITGVGIVSFIPYIGSLFSLFSPFVLRRFRKRKTVMLSSKLCFYFLFIEKVCVKSILFRRIISILYSPVFGYFILTAGIP